MPPPSISPLEWVLATSVLLLIGCFILIAKINAHRASAVISEASFLPETVVVTIEGAVKKPGPYAVPAGTPIGQVLRKARPCPDANLKILPLKEIVDQPLHLVVEELQEIQVTVTGAIQEPVHLTLPAKSRICDLKSKVIFTDETERAFFKRRKLLRDGDKIEVPKKSVELNSAH